MSLLTLVKTFLGSSSYATDHENNYTAIETAVNTLSDSVVAATSPMAMPPALKELYDRNGIMGKASYFPDDNGGVALPSNNLTIAAGAYWSGAEFRNAVGATTINMTSFSTGTLYVNVPSGGVPIVSASASADTVWQFAYDQGTDIVTLVALYSTADILFDGDDYNDMLGVYNSVGDRIAAIEAASGLLAGYYAEDAGSHVGLNFGYFGGKVRDDNVINVTAADTILLANNTTNYIELTAASGVVSTNTTSYTSGLIPLFVVDTVAGAIDSVLDDRTWAQTGGGGGHAQNTDTGTTNTSFTLNNDEAGTPSSNCSLVVERGTSPNVDIRWNETTNVWEFTNDGTIYEEIGAADFDLGAQELTKYVPVLDPVQIIERLAISTDGAYLDVNLGPSGTNVITDAPQGAQGLVLRVQFWDSDSTPASTVNVKFKQYNGAASPTKAWTVWAAGVNEQDKVQTLIIPGDDGNTTSPIVGFSYKVTASGASAANVRVFLCGYMVKVTGVGSQTKAFSSSGNTVASLTTTNFNKTGFLNRGLVYKLVVTETGGTMTGTYDIKFYSKDTFLAADLLYSATGISATADSRIYTDRLPYMYLDDDLTSELHVKIINNDGAQSGTWTIAITAEQFL